MKLTARGFAAAVSFIFFPTYSGRFQMFAPLNDVTTAHFIFSESNRKMPASFIQFHVKLPIKKGDFSIKSVVKADLPFLRGVGRGV